MIHFVCALKCEASPIIDYYDLNYEPKSDLFNIYVNKKNRVSLTISGTGKLAAAAATTYSYTLLECEKDEVWINFGVAGHASFSLGNIYLVNRIEDAGNAQTWYPQMIIDSELPGAGLLTLDQPSTDYNDFIFDMEAAGFISSACRFSSSELTQCLKIISDNHDSPASGLSAATITKLIAEVTGQIVTYAAQLQSLSRLPGSEIDVTCDFQQFTGRWHFTSYQQNVLKKLLHRYHVLSPAPTPLQLVDDGCDDAKAVLKSLASNLDKLPFFLDKPDV